MLTGLVLWLVGFGYIFKPLIVFWGVWVGCPGKSLFIDFPALSILREVSLGQGYCRTCCSFAFGLLPALLSFTLFHYDGEETSVQVRNEENCYCPMLRFRITTECRCSRLSVAVDNSLTVLCFLVNVMITKGDSLTILETEVFYH